nr:2-C-methyl-D-erythritol 4-phosphate cytidylyltransferase [Polycladospora coralii]
MGTDLHKQYLSIEGTPILIHTLRRFASHPEIQKIIVAVHAHEQTRAAELISAYQLDHITEVHIGGTERQDSVRLSLMHLHTEWVIVHDAVRPFITQEAITSVISNVQTRGAVILAVPMKDTVKQVTADGIVSCTPDRKELWSVQTPQAFKREWLEEAHEQALNRARPATDDAMLVEEMGHPVYIVEGDYTNIKITTPEDLYYADAIIQMRRK